MTKWVAAFLLVAVVFGALSINFASATAQTVAVISFLLGVLTLIGTVFEKSASAKS